MSPSTDQLLIQCQKGNPKAQKTLYEQYKTVLFAVCLRYACDSGEAEDFLQEAFIVIFRDIGKFRNEGSLEGWLRRVTSRVAITQLRKKYPARFSESFDALPSEYATSVPVHPEFEEEAILALLQQMPEGYRTVFNLRCIEEYSYEEIALNLHITESTVRSQYVRACRFMRKLVEKMLSTLV